MDETTQRIDRRPAWLKTARPVWSEDDAMPPDAESLEQAWFRIVGTRLPDASAAIEAFDGGDAFFYLHEGGWIAIHSYPGNSEIRKTEASHG